MSEKSSDVRETEPRRKRRRGRDLFAKYRFLIDVLVGFCKMFPMSFRKRWLGTFRRTRGKLGLGARYVLLKSVARRCGDNVAIYEDVYFYNPQNLVVGDNVSFHPMCYVECGSTIENGLQIGDDVSIAHGATIMPDSHTFSDSTVPIKDQPMTTEPIHICDNVWIGAKVSILNGVTIRSGCVVGAGSVVTKDTEENGIYVGVPARKIKKRDC